MVNVNNYASDCKCTIHIHIYNLITHTGKWRELKLYQSILTSADIGVGKKRLKCFVSCYRCSKCLN
jgi:hypothetical protein